MVERAGWGNAIRYLLTGDEFTVDDALRFGFVPEIAPPGRHLDRALEIAERIAAQAPLAVRAVRASARSALDRGTRAATAELTERQRALLASADAREGLQSFIERRSGRFIGR
jgi:enoyl-CoA hydratase/carnithine racemase